MANHYDDDDQDDDKHVAAELQPYQGQSKWMVYNNTIHVEICKIPGTEKYLTTSCPVTRFAAGSWELMNDEALAALLAKAQAETERRRALRDPDAAR